MKKIIVGTDTNSVEDYYQCVVLLVPEYLDGEALDEALRRDFFGFEQQQIVTWEDISEAFLLALMAEKIDYGARVRIITAVRDAMANNDL